MIDENSVCLCISDESLLPLMAAKLGAQQVGSYLILFQCIALKGHLIDMYDGPILLP